MGGIRYNNSVVNRGNVPALSSGSVADRPTAGLLGAIYFAVDTQEIFRDNGISWTLIANVGGSVPGVVNEYYGTIYESNTWNDLSDFVNSGTTVSVVANKLQFSGGANTFTQSLGLSQNSKLENWTITSKIKVDEKSATSHGFGIGVRSSNVYSAENLLVRFNATTGAGTGLLLLYSSQSNTLVSSSETALSFSVNDYIVINIEKSGGEVVAKAYNLTTNSAVISASYQFEFLQGSTTANNTGRYSIFSFGGQFTVDSLNVFSKEVLNPDILIIGDSKTVGFNATNYSDSYSQILKTKLPNTAIHAGASDRLVEVLLSINEIIALNPSIVLLAIGSNDIRSGRSSASYLADYDTLTNTLSSVGITVIHLLTFYETSVNITPLYNHIVANYSASLIDTYTPTRLSGSLSPDGIHLQPSGHRLVAETVLNSGVVNGETAKVFSNDSNILYGASGGGVAYNKHLTYDRDNTQVKFGSKVRIGTNSFGFGSVNLRGENVGAANVETLLQVANDLYIGRPTGNIFFRSNSTTQVAISATGVLNVAEKLLIGSASTVPEVCAKFQIDSTIQGLLLPRMTKAQRDLISTPIAGLMVFQTDNTPGLRVYNGTNWIRYSEIVD